MRLLRAYPLTAFFVLAYALTWLLWAPLVLTGTPAFSETTHLPSPYALPGVAVGVTGTAFFMTAVTAGRAGVRRLLARLVCWQVEVRWYAVAVLLMPILALLIAAALTGRGTLTALTPAALLAYPAAYLGHFVFGPLFEETGWRGFALPRMQHRFGPLRASLLLGLLWAGWHVFLYAPGWFGGGAGAGLAAMALFTAFTTALSVVFTWLSNNTRASLLLAMLLHGSVNGTSTYAGVLADRGVISPDAAAVIAGTGMLGAAVLAAVAVSLLTRRRLSYPRYRYEAEHFDVPRPAVSRPGRTRG